MAPPRDCTSRRRDASESSKFANRCRAKPPDGPETPLEIHHTYARHLFKPCGSPVVGAADNESPAEGVYVSHEIHDWLERQGIAPSFATFESQGVAVGQGLRTGANGFFYADGVRSSGHIALSFSGPLAGWAARAPDSIARPVIRRQSELPAGFVVSPELATGWALDLRQHALPEDLGEADMFASVYEHMPQSIAAVVRAAGQANFGTDTKPQKVWNLTAVSPNIRPAARGMPPRHWYMLPDFAARHLPDVLLARVNSATPTAYLNKARQCLIDANFSTMWALPLSKWKAAALLAFMNSAWARAVIETSGAVMGGGALKVEAAHLRRFPVPVFNEEQLCKLSRHGDELAAVAERAEVEAALNTINAVVAEALGCDREGIKELQLIARTGQERRAKHNTKKGGHDRGELC